MYYYKWLTTAISFFLVPSYILATSARIFAYPKAAVVYKLYDQETGEWNQILSGESDSYENKPPKKDDRLINLNQFLWIPGNESWATFSYLSSDNNKQYLGVAAGPSKNAATYRFPCQFAGGTNVIGWSKGMPDEGEMCAIQGAEISFQEDIVSSEKFSNSIAQKNLSTTQKFITQAPEYSNSLIRYCTVAAKNRGWWISRGTSNQPCRDAYQQCLSAGGANDCQVLSLGNWRIRNKDLLVNISCEDSRNYQSRGNGKEILDNLLILKEASQAKAGNSRMCILNVYKPTSLIVAPASKQATMVQTRADDQSIVIEALAGDVVIRSAQKPEGFILKVGNRYIYPSDIIEPINVEQVVANSPAVQNFLEPNNWFPGAEEQLDQYQANLGQSSNDPVSQSPNPENPNTNDPNTNENEKDSNLLEQIAPILLPIAISGLIDLFSGDNDNDDDNNDSQNDDEPSSENNNDNNDSQNPNESSSGEIGIPE